MMHVDINTPSWRYYQFNHEVNDVELKCVANLIDKVRDVTHIREFSTKQRATRRYNSKVMPREMQEGDLVLRKIVLPTK